MMTGLDRPLSATRHQRCQICTTALAVYLRLSTDVADVAVRSQLFDRDSWEYACAVLGVPEPDEAENVSGLTAADLQLELEALQMYYSLVKTRVEKSKHRDSGADMLAMIQDTFQEVLLSHAYWSGVEYGVNSTIKQGIRNALIRYDDDEDDDGNATNF